MVVSSGLTPGLNVDLDFALLYRTVGIETPSDETCQARTFESEFYKWSCIRHVYCTRPNVARRMQPAAVPIHPGARRLQHVELYNISFGATD